MRQFVPSLSTLQEVLKEVLCAESKGPETTVTKINTHIHTHRVLVKRIM